MGLFDKFFKKTVIEKSYVPLTEAEAWFGIFYACLNSDGEIDGEDIEKLIDLFITEDKFSGEDITTIHIRVGEASIEMGGLELVKACSKAISDGDKLHVFEIAARIVLSDFILDKQEQLILEAIANEMGISAAETDSIINKITKEGGLSVVRL